MALSAKLHGRVLETTLDRGQLLNVLEAELDNECYHSAETRQTLAAFIASRGK